MPRLRVLAGPSPSELKHIDANAYKAHPIKSEFFEGQVVVHIKGFPDEDGNVLMSDYFDRPDRQGITWSIQVQGRFLQPHSADDILFGNTFDRPLKLPWGTSAALRFMKFVDPTLEHDLMGPKPWALSPLVSTMPHLTHTPVSKGAKPPTFPSRTESIGDDVSALVSLSPSSSSSSSGVKNDSSDSDRSSIGSQHSSSSNGSLASIDSGSGSNSGKSASSTSSSSSSSSLSLSKRRRPFHSSTSTAAATSGTGGAHPQTDPRKRRAHFASPAARQRVTLGPGDVLTTDFCYGFLAFPALALTLPGGLSFDLTRYWDGQPVRFVCCERGRARSNAGEGESEGEGEKELKVFWCVAIESVDE